MDGEAGDVSLECSESAGGPTLGGFVDPAIQVLGVLGHGARGLPGEAVDLAFVRGAEVLAGHVPLEQHEERGAARGPAALTHAGLVSTKDESLAASGTFSSR